MRGVQWDVHVVFPSSLLLLIKSFRTKDTWSAELPQSPKGLQMTPPPSIGKGSSESIPLEGWVIFLITTIV